MAEQKKGPLIKTHAVLHKISKWISYVGGAMTIIMMLMVVADVISRLTFNKPILGSVEIASYMLSIIAFTTIPLVESENMHIAIPLLFDRLPKKIRLFASALIGFFGLGILALIALASYLLAVEYIGRGKVTQVLSIPIYPFVFIAAVCILLYAIILFVNTVEYIYQNK